MENEIQYAGKIPVRDNGMDTKIIGIDENRIDIGMIAEAGQIIARGGLVAFPTETVYGLGANALDETAVRKIFAAKGRPADNPLIVHVCAPEGVKQVVREIPPTAAALFQAFSPGPLTVIMPKAPGLNDAVTAGLDTVAVRIPAHKTARALIEAAGVPVAAPSGNLSGKPSPTKPEHILADMNGRADAIILGGDCTVGVESTVVDVTGEIPVILRPGGITRHMLETVLGRVEIDRHVLELVAAEDKPKCPGMKYKHYAPDAEVTVIEGSLQAVRSRIIAMLREQAGKKTGVLAYSGGAYKADLVLTVGADNQSYARNLFGDLRAFDQAGIEVVFAEFCGDMGYGLAVRNRLYKSAAGRVIQV